MYFKVDILVSKIYITKLVILFLHLNSLFPLHRVTRILKIDMPSQMNFTHFPPYLGTSIHFCQTILAYSSKCSPWEKIHKWFNKLYGRLKVNLMKKITKIVQNCTMILTTTNTCYIRIINNISLYIWQGQHDVALTLSLSLIKKRSRTRPAPTCWCIQVTEDGFIRTTCWIDVCNFFFFLAFLCTVRKVLLVGAVKSMANRKPDYQNQK